MRFMTFLFTFILSISNLLAQPLKPEDYYNIAYTKITSMLEGKDSLSIKYATFLAEWAFYEGKLDYNKNFCDEIDRITKFIIKFYHANNLSRFKNGKQMALNQYFFNPYSGNGYNPYTYDYESFSIENEPWENQFVSKVLISHKGQCRSLPWLYKILACEINADAYIAYAPRHSYIMYRDEDNITPEPWINLELTTHQLTPSEWIQSDFEIRDDAIKVGTYMTPLTDVQTVASQLADLAFGYCEKFNRYDDFTLKCSSKSLVYFHNNPNAIIIKGKSLENKLRYHFLTHANFINQNAINLSIEITKALIQLNETHMTDETPEKIKLRVEQMNITRKLKNNINR